MVANHYVELYGATDTGERYCLAHHIHTADDGSGKLDFVMAIRYLDRYRRSDLPCAVASDVTSAGSCIGPVSQPMGLRPPAAIAAACRWGNRR